MVVIFRFVHKSQLRGNSSLKHLNSVIMKEQNYVRHVPTRLQQLNWKMWKGGILIQIFSSRSRVGSDNDTAHLTLHIWHCSLDTAHLTLYTWHCTLDTAHLTLHTWHCTLDTTHLTLYTWHCTLDTAHLTLHGKWSKEILILLRIYQGFGSVTVYPADLDNWVTDPPENAMEFLFKMLWYDIGKTKTY